MQEKNSDCFRGIRKWSAQQIAHKKENKAKEKKLSIQGNLLHKMRNSQSIRIGSGSIRINARA